MAEHQWTSNRGQLTATGMLFGRDNLQMTLLAAIGDISRFSQPKNLVGYAGLGAHVHDSGQCHPTG